MTHTPSEGLDLQVLPIAALIGEADHPAGDAHLPHLLRVKLETKRMKTRTAMQKDTPPRGKQTATTTTMKVATWTEHDDGTDVGTARSDGENDDITIMAARTTAGSTLVHPSSGDAELSLETSLGSRSPEQSGPKTMRSMTGRKTQSRTSRSLPKR